MCSYHNTNLKSETDLANFKNLSYLHTAQASDSVSFKQLATQVFGNAVEIFRKFRLGGQNFFIND